jgi:uncharacterized protein YjiS (DUF1127 family)
MRNAMMAISLYFRERKAISELSRLSDKDLADIGLTRCNIRNAVRNGINSRN